MRPVTKLLNLVPFEQFHMDASTPADISDGWRFTGRVAAMAITQNLFDLANAGPAGSFPLVTQVPHSAGYGCE